LSGTSFYIAQRYLIAKKGNTAVTFITLLAAFAMMTAVAAMFIIISVFSGLETLNRDMIANLHADLTISPAQGKKLQNIQQITDILHKNSDVENFSNVIEEKVYISYNNIGEIGYLRGVDSAYTSVNPVNKSIFFGKYPSFRFSNEAVIENGLDNRLSIPVGETNDAAWLFMPKPGSGIITKEEDIFNKKQIFVTGVFPGNDQLNNYIIAPIELAQELLNLPKNSAYQIVIKLKNPDTADTVKENILQKIGSGYVIKTKNEENSAFWKMINTEKLMIYLIFSLVIFITTFNLAGAIIILQLDKKEQSRALIAMGFSLKSLRRTYFYTGILIVVFGIIAGLMLGTAASYFQQSTGFFKANESLPFPTEIRMINYFIVAGVAFLFGGIVSWIFSKINKELILTK